MNPIPTSEQNEHRHEEDLNLFLDGELPLDRHGDLYARLADDDSSRSFVDQVMLFRRMSREEFIDVPQSADDQFFERLAALKKAGQQIDRFEDREPLWNARRPVSVRTAVAAVVVLFMTGLMLPLSGAEATGFIEQEQERVMFETPQTRVMQSYIYVFEPGLTIEAEQ